MNNDLFHKKNPEKPASPEQFHDYIHISNPSAWVALAAFTILLAGVCIWGIFGRLDTTLSVVGVKETDSIVCYVRKEDQPKVGIGMAVEIDGEEYSITEIEKNPVPVDSSVQEYAKYIGNLNDGEWVYPVRTDCGKGTEGEVFSAEIVIERVNPLYFITN